MSLAFAGVSLWIGNAIFILVVVPALVLVLEQVREPVRQIGAYAQDITAHVTLFGPHMEALEDLARTRDLVKQVNGQLEGYVRALDNLR